MSVEVDIIEYPRKQSEAEIQAILWTKLRNKGLDARLEVIGRLDGRYPKLDIVVFRGQVPQLIIECKAWTKNSRMERLYKEGLYNTKQLRRYHNFGLPVFICGGLNYILKTLEKVISSYYDNNFDHVSNINGDNNA